MRSYSIVPTWNQEVTFVPSVLRASVCSGLGRRAEQAEHPTDLVPSDLTIYETAEALKSIPHAA